MQIVHNKMYPKLENNNEAIIEMRQVSTTESDRNIVQNEANNNSEDGNADIEGEEVVEKSGMNTYAAKKSVAQGMMDIALITANANQLRYLIELNRKSSTYYLIFALITISLILQVGVGVSLIFKTRLDVRGESKKRSAKQLNNYVVVGIFLITIVNVFIASFTTTTGNV